VLIALGTMNHASDNFIKAVAGFVIKT
jgi:hypothetical protein